MCDAVRSSTFDILSFESGAPSPHACMVITECNEGNYRITSCYPFGVVQFTKVMSSVSTLSGVRRGW